ncbi:trypsin-like peptidase domain-containing protein [Streptomyces sp. NPDC101152]|uniref:nSTAND1 domain-containing NTPase n=1 Tax=Streptomyces sp. NPDC101152 TaxID=3366116 RepID=UPI00381D57C5
MADSGDVDRSVTGSHVSAAVAQILDSAGEVAGAGFLVADTIVVTCAHVVSAAGFGPGGTVGLAFPQASGVPRAQGQVLVEPWRAPAAEDIAVIRLAQRPAGVAPLPLGSAGGCRGHRVRSFGYPSQAPSGGHHGYGTAGHLLAPGSADAEESGALLQLTDANDLTTGFSGAPVIDEQTGRVIGMVTAIAAPDVHVKGLGIAYATPTEVLRDVWPQLAVREDARPYRELEAFTAEHAAWFHGRDTAVERVLAALAGQRRAVLLLGPSGAGKSSLVQAGVLPALSAGRLPGSDRWLPVVVRPEQDLPTAIERAGLPGSADDGIVAAVERRLTAEPGSHRVLLVIDQFEELLTQAVAGGSAGDRHLAALRRLTAAITSPAALGVLLVMRDDFYPRLAALAPELLDAVAPGLVNVPATLDAQDLDAMITLPARAAGAHFEEGLPERICNGSTGSLTLWQSHDMAHVVPIHPLPGVDGDHNGPVLFEPGTDVLLHATGNGVQQWDVGDPYQPGASATEGQIPNGFERKVVISGGRKRLLAVVGGDSGQLVDLTGSTGHHVVADLPGGSVTASAAAFTPDGTVFADSEHTGTGKAILRLRDTTRPGVPALDTIDSIDQGVVSIVFSPDGRIMAVADNNDATNGPYPAGPSVKLFDVHDPAHPQQLARLSANASQVAISPDGRLLTANTAETLLTWNISDPRHPVARPTYRLTPARLGSGSASAFRPDGQWIAVRDSSGTIRLWKVDGDRLTATLGIIHAPGADGIPSFSPDGRTLAFVEDGDLGNVIGPEDNRARVALWDVTDPQAPVPQGGMAHQDSLGMASMVAFSPTGHFLVTTISQSVDLWSTLPEDNEDELCRAVGDVITSEEWREYVPHEPYTPPCRQPNVPASTVPVPTRTS